MSIHSAAVAALLTAGLGLLSACGGSPTAGRAPSSAAPSAPTSAPTSASPSAVATRTPPTPHAGDHIVANADLDSAITDSDLPWRVPGLALFLEAERVATGTPASSPRVRLMTLSDAGGKVWAYYSARSRDDAGYEAVATDASGRWTKVSRWHGPVRVPLCRALAADGVPADLGRDLPDGLPCRYGGKQVTYSRRFTP